MAGSRREAYDGAAGKVRWYEGKGSLVAWHNHCPLIVSIEPRELRRLREPGQPVFGYSHSIGVSGHLSASSETLAGALQEAILLAVECGREGSDSRWLNGRGGRKGFFASHGVEEGVTPSRVLEDYMTPGNMTARVVEDAEEAAAAPGMR